MKNKNVLNGNMIWCVLVTIAYLQGRTITYEELGDLTGINHRNLGLPLELVANYCNANKLPQLTALVVRKDTGMPSEGSARFGAATPTELFQIRKHLYEFDWRALQHVSIDSIAA